MDYFRRFNFLFAMPSFEADSLVAAKGQHAEGLRAFGEFTDEIVFGEIAERLAAAGRVLRIGIEQLHEGSGMHGVAIVGPANLQRALGRVG